MRAYLDHAAAARPSDAVRRAMTEACELVGSPGSVHDAGRAPAALIDAAREAVAELIGGRPEEVIFTAGATEARNLAVKGLLRANARLGASALISAVEHPATRAAARTATGGEVAEVPVDDEGGIDPDDLARRIDNDTALIALPHGQGDIGTLQDLPELIGAARRTRDDARLLIDAGDTVGRVPIDVGALGCDALVIGAWPMGAPPWAGALWVREGARITPLIEGGIQEHGKRSGAEALPAIAALGAAARGASSGLTERAEALRALSGHLMDGLLAHAHVRLNGPRRARIPGHVQVSVGDVEAETMVLALAARGVAASPGSACTAYAGKAAPALEAIGLEAPWTQSSVLFTLGEGTTRAEVDHAVIAFGQVLNEYRPLSAIRL